MTRSVALSRDLLLVTGGAGFIGSNIARAAAEDGYRVVVADWLEDGPKWRNIADIRLHDVIRPETVNAFVEKEGGRLAAVVHMGAISATTERDADRIVARNIRATLDLWEICARKALGLIYASSAATYGDGGSGFVDSEEGADLAALAPLNPYGWSKLFVDRRIMADVSEGRARPPQFAGLRFFNVYGPGEAHKGDMRSVVHKIYPQAEAGESVTLFKSHDPRYADGGQLRDFVYVADCVEFAGCWRARTCRASSMSGPDRPAPLRIWRRRSSRRSARPRTSPTWTCRRASRRPTSISPRPTSRSCAQPASRAPSPRWRTGFPLM